MKKYILLVFFIFTFTLLHAQNEEKQNTKTDSTEYIISKKTRNGILKMDPLSLLFTRNLNAKFEQAVGNKSSLLVGLNIFQWRHVFNESISGVCIQLGYRRYFSKTDNAPEGLFVSPILEFGAITYIPDGYSFGLKEHSLTMSVGGKGGYQWLFDNGVALDLSFGYSYYSFNFDTYTEKIATPTIGAAVGYYF